MWAVHFLCFWVFLNDGALLLVMVDWGFEASVPRSREEMGNAAFAVDRLRSSPPPNPLQSMLQEPFPLWSHVRLCFSHLHFRSAPSNVFFQPRDCYLLTLGSSPGNGDSLQSSIRSIRKRSKTPFHWKLEARCTELAGNVKLRGFAEPTFGADQD